MLTVFSSAQTVPVKVLFGNLPPWQLCGGDFVFDKNGHPLIVEISYGYSIEAYDMCEGYWTKDMIFHSGTHFDISAWMVEEVLREVNAKNNNQ